MKSVQRVFSIVSVIGLTGIVVISAHAADTTMLTLSKPQLTCKGRQAQIDLSWTSTMPVQHFSVSRKYSWREGWQTIKEKLSDTTITDIPRYNRPRTFTYQVSAVIDGKTITSNSVRANVAECFPQSPSIQKPFADPVVLFPRDIPRNLWGASVGYLAEDGPAFEELAQKTMTARSTEVYWGNEHDFPFHLADAFTGKTMVLFWNPGDYTSENVNDERFSYESILKGKWDAYIAAFATQAKEYGKPVILVPFSEMNGNWYPWGGTVNGNSAESHIRAYRHLHAFFEEVPNVYFGWSVTSESVPDIGTNSIVGYYPGKDYVDIVGVTGYNYGTPWASFHDIFSPALFTFQIFQKPVMIFGMGTTEGERKAEWITDAITLQTLLYPEIIGWLWNNVPYDPQYDWSIDSSTSALEAFRKAISHLQ